MIGTKHTPVRQVIDRAAAFIPRPRSALCAVVTHEGVAGLGLRLARGGLVGGRGPVGRSGTSSGATGPGSRCCRCCRAMYDELWVGAKGMYKTEPAIADGGEVIIYAPHLHEVSVVHGKLIRADRLPRARLLPGPLGRVQAPALGRAGALHPPQGRRHLRGRRRAAAHPGHPGHRDLRGRAAAPSTSATATRARIDPKSFAGRESEGVLLVPKAGEYLYRLRAA